MKSKGQVYEGDGHICTDLNQMWWCLSDIMAKGQQPLLMKVPVKVHLRHKGLNVEGKVDKQAALCQQRHQQPCTGISVMRDTL